MEHLKETKTDTQSVSSSSSSTSASCSSSSSASSSSPPAEVPHDPPHEDHSLPGLPSLSSPTSSPASSNESDTDASKAEPGSSSSASFFAPPSTSAVAESGGAQGMDVDGEGKSEEAGVPSDEMKASSSSAADMETEQLVDSLSSSTLSSSSAESASSSSSSTSAPSSCPSSSSAPPATCDLSTVSLDADEQGIQALLKTMHSDVKKGEASVRAILKMLQGLQRAPQKAEHRRMRRDNIVVKKNIVDVPGALALMELIGYRSVELNQRPYLALPDDGGANTAVLDKAVKLLLQYAERQASDEKKPASVTSAVRVRCAGGCGYWGDAAQENLCSICHKTKHMGAAAVKAMTGIAGVEAARCSKGCGLFGAEKFGGLCSQCYAKEKAEAAAKEAATSAPRTRAARIASARRKLHALWVFGQGKQAEQVNKQRCFTCSKRLPVPIECRCRRTFCSQHRFPLDHQCSYDAQSEHKKRLRKALILTQTSKMDRI